MPFTSSKDSIYTDSNSDGATRYGHAFRRGPTLREYIVAYASIGVGVGVFVVFLYFYLTPLFRQHRAEKAEKRRQSLLRPLGLDNESLRFTELSKTFLEKKIPLSEPPPEAPSRVAIRDSLAAKVVFRLSHPADFNPLKPAKRRICRLSSVLGSRAGRKTFNDDSSRYSVDKPSQISLGLLAHETDTISAISNFEKTISSFDSSKKATQKMVDAGNSPTVPAIPSIPAVAYASTISSVRSTANARLAATRVRANQSRFQDSASQPCSVVPVQGNYSLGYSDIAAPNEQTAISSQSTYHDSQAFNRAPQTWANATIIRSTIDHRLQAGNPTYVPRYVYLPNDHDFSKFY